MDTDTFKNNLKTLKELILDEQKLVTYISLSRELCIHVNEAKSLLKHIIQDLRNSQPKTDIYVCYVISGLLDNNSACTTVCTEADKEELRKTLKIIFYEHVYSVSRGVQSVDNVAFTAINKFEDFPLCTGLIKANSCVKRTDDEIGNLKSSSHHAITNESKPPVSIKKNTTEKKKELVANGTEDVKKITQVKSEPIIKSKTPSPKKDTSSNNTNASIKKNGTKTAPKSIAGFFNKTNGDTKAKNTKAKEEKEFKTETKVEKEVKIKEEPSTVVNDKPIKVEKDESVNKTKDKSTNNALKQIKKNAKVDKKRKRVLHVSDSESDTEANDPFADDNKMAVDDPESDDEIPPTPTVNTVKITSGIVNPKKRRKLVDKTYTDEDGFILTKKEEVYESCSDNEEEKPIVKQEKENIKQVTQVKVETSPKENGKAKKKKVSPPQKGKQPTMTNFFKRK
ncbi:uncharacterized protein LOC142976521 [Anticarsia gemmatalis]|uniref:uncharacterized protein LOC142976521 n=1 Tax=Anticarsia gemmatalis TaxID=129554 RepID=UPI003F75B87A